ncbi:MAG: VOC family protein [Kurthia sp.]|nr:VOC family protein [Candidatus Kurthia equi]
MTNLFHKKPNLYVSHVQLKVSNLARSIEYYKSVIGFQVLEQSNDTAYLTFDGKTSLISLVEVANAQQVQGATGLYHFALLLPTRKDLGNIVQYFVENNVKIGAGDHDVSEALYLYDPDGNGIEIYADRPAEDWKWDANDQVYMSTETVNFESVLADADGTWNGLPEGTVMGHIHLSVRDLVHTKEFYTNVLDYNVVTVYGNQALFISTGKYHHHIGLNTWNSLGGPALPASATGLKSYTIVLKDEAYATQVAAELTNAGYPVEKFAEAPEFGGAQAFSTVDPNGIRIIFTTDGE